MKIAVGYPYIDSPEGTPLLSQNRQYQYFHKKTTLFPVVMGTAATWLRDKGYDVLWLDAIAEELSKEQFFRILEKEKIDLFFFETKAPAVKRQWKIINEMKERFPNMKTVVCGDHVSAVDTSLGFQKEFFENSKTDYVINGGYFDFAICELADALNKKEKIPEGIWYREDGKIIDNGRYNLKGNLDEAPIVDRKLTKNDLYQYEFNLKGRPLAYIMSGRDCWWGRCTFCFDPDTDIITKNGIKSIKDLTLGEEVLTYNGQYNKTNFIWRRSYSGDMIHIKIHNLPETIKCTPNHKFYVSRYNETKLIEASGVKEGDYLTFPIIREVVDIPELDVYDLLSEKFVEVPTRVRTLQPELVQNIFELEEKNYSTGGIASELGIDRGTVMEYLRNEPKGKITLEKDDKNVGFKYGKSLIPRKLQLTKEFMRLAGYYLAEGSASFSSYRPNSGTLQFTFNKNETEYINDVKNIIEKLFDIEAVLVENKANNTIQVTIYSNILTYLFKSLLGSGSLNKDIPAEFMKLPLEKQRELIIGLFRGDAHLRKENRSPEYILNTVSKQMAYKIWMILTRFDIVPSFYISKKETRDKAKHDQYVLALNCGGIKRLGIKVEGESRGNKYTKIVNDMILFPIQQINREEYIGDVYNLSVENDHSYTANCIAASNCVWDTNLYPRGTFRARSPEHVLKEVQYLVDECGVREIFDDCGTITIGPWLKKFCDLMIKSGYNKKVMYSCNMRFGAVDAEEYKLMKKAGFRLLKYGLESGNQKTIDKLDKGTKIEEVEKSCREAKEAGLVVHLTMMVGYPWETRKDAERTFKLAKKLMIKGYADVLQGTVMIPYPGTPLWVEGLQKGWFRIDPRDYDSFGMTEPVFKTPDMKPEEVLEMVNKIYTIFWHPEYVSRHFIEKLRSMEDVRYTYEGVKAVVGHMMDFSRNVDVDSRAHTV